jgi:hypothetical protein
MVFHSIGSGWQWSLLLLAGLIGCTGRKARVGIGLGEPAETTKAMFQALDNNSDGSIQGDELGGCPGLAASLGAWDTDGNKGVSTAEAQQQFEKWKAMRVGAINASTTLNLNGNPLRGAKVEWVPESWMGSNFPTATSTTDPSGRAIAKVAASGDRDASLGDGLPPGFYRLVITHPEVPEKYRVNSQAGIMIAPNDPMGLLKAIELTTE